MSTRAESLRKNIDALVEYMALGDEGITLTRPTVAQKKEAEQIADDFSPSLALRDVGILLANLYADALVEKGMRPADYAQLQDISATFARILSKKLAENPPEFSSAFHATLKGWG